MTIQSEVEATENAVGWQFDSTYSRLPAVFFSRVTPAKFRAPSLSILNLELARELGLNLDALSRQSVADLFSGQQQPAACQPIAQAYAGHQYGGFTMLGDGRAILLGEHRTPSGQLVDIQLKGAGQTPYSRAGDGRAALGPMLREYVISEAMAALGVPTTRSLAVVATGEPVHRTTVLKGAILTRVAASHLRVGTFQYAAAWHGETMVRVLADYAIQRHYPQVAQTSDKYANFLLAVIDSQASLIAQWQLNGFVHGVMNTDNMAISGETIDFGPCAFMNAYDPSTVFSSIDRGGRYAYGNQPAIARWNLARFAETLLPLIDADQDQAVTRATEAIDEFQRLFEHYWLTKGRAKLGLEQVEADDLELVQSLMQWMHERRADFTNTFRDLSSEVAGDGIYKDADFRKWHERWQARLLRENRQRSEIYTKMRSINPAIIPRNHRVEEALAAAQDEDDLSVLHRLLAALAKPYESSHDIAPYREPPPDDRSYRTFCGT